MNNSATLNSSSLILGGNTYTFSGTSGTVCENTNNCGYALGQNYFQMPNSGAIAPFSTTADLLLGGTATTSAKFAFINNSGSGVPTASISANSGNNATYLTGDGTLGTTNAQTLTLGSASTGNIVIEPGGAGNAVINTQSLSGSTGSISFQTGNSTSGTSGNISIDTGTGIISGTPVINDTFEGSGSGSDDDMFAWYFDSITPSNTESHSDNYSLKVTETSTSWGLSENYGAIPVTPGDEYQFTGWVRAGSVGETITESVSWDGVGSTATLSTVTDNSTGWTEFSGEAVAPPGASAAYVFFQSISGGASGQVQYFDDINITNLNNITAPSVNIGASNAEAITIGNASQVGSTSLLGGGEILELAGENGAINIGASNANNLTIGNSSGITTIAGSNFAEGQVAFANSANTLAFTSGGSSNQCLLNGGSSGPIWGACDIGTTSWVEANGTIYPGNITEDLLLGGAATTSAKFAFINNSGSGVPTASISANSGNNATYLTGSGVLGTTNMQTLTLGSTSTGNISLSPGGITNGINVTSAGEVTLSSAPATPFGNANIGTYGGSDYGLLTAQEFTSSAGGGGSVSSMSVYIHSGVGASHQGQLAIYSDSSGTPGSYIASTAVTTLTGNSWNTMPITATLLPSTTYWFIFWTNDSAGSEEALVSPASAGNFDYSNVGWQCSSGCSGGTTNGFPNTFPTPVSFSSNNYDATIYVTDSQTSGPAMTIDPSGNIVQLGYNTELSLKGTNSYISNTQGYTNSEVFGLNASVTGIDAVAVGNQAQSQDYGDSVGTNAVAFPGAVAIGSGAQTNNGSAGGYGVAIGNGASSATNGIAIGQDAADVNDLSIALGYNATTTASNQLVIGSAYTSGTGMYINNGYFGSGVTDTSPQSFTLNATGGSGSNVTGANLYLAGGKGTGNATGGIISFETSALGLSGSTLQSLVERMRIDNYGNVGIGSNFGSNQALATLDVRGNSGTTPVASFSGKSAIAGLVIDQSGSGDILAASKSGTSVLTLTNAGGIALFGSQGSGNQCITSGGVGQAVYWGACGGAGLFSNFWQFNNGTIDPFSTTADLLLGGTATTSAKFAFEGVDTNSPVASIAANPASGTSNGLVLAGATDSIQSLNNNTLTIGGNTTGDIAFQAGGTNHDLYLASNGNVGIGTTNPSNTLAVQTTPSLQNAIVNIFGTTCASCYDYGILEVTSAGGAIAAGQERPLQLQPAGDAFGTVGIGLGSNNDPLATFDVRGNSSLTSVATISGNTSSSAFVVDNSGSGALFSANSSGLNRFTITQNGNVGIGTTNPNALLQVAGTASISGQLTIYGTPQIQSTANQTLTIGGTTTGDISFTPGGQAVGNSLYLVSNGGVGVGTSVTGNDQLVVNQPNASGDIFSASQSGSTKFLITNTGNVSIESGGLNIGGTAQLSNGLLINTYNQNQIALDTQGVGWGYISNPFDGTWSLAYNKTNSAQTTSTSVLSWNNNGAVGIDNTIPGNSSLAIDQPNAGGDIFSASSSGVTKFVINNAGNVGIGTSTPGQALSIVSNANTWSNNTGSGTFNITSSDSTQTGITVNNTSTGGHIWSITNSGANAWGGAGNFEIADNTDMAAGLNSGAVRLAITGNGFVGINSINGSGTPGMGDDTLVVNQPNSSGDIFSASQSGNTKFVISNSGNVGIGTTNPLTNLIAAGGGNIAGEEILNPINSGGHTAALALSSVGNGGDLIAFGANQNGGNEYTGLNGASIGFNQNVAGALELDTNGIDSNKTTIDNLIITSGGFVGINTPIVSNTSTTGNDSLVINQPNSSGDIFTASQSGNTKFVISNSGNVGIGTATPVALLQINSAYGNNAALIVNQLNNGDLFDASQGGVLKFAISNSGAITTGSYTASIIGSQYGGTGADLHLQTVGAIPYFSGTGVMGGLAAGSIGQCLEGNGAASPIWATCAGGQNYWQMPNSGAIAPFSTTADLLLGGTATTSAKFAFTGVDTTSPVASIAANPASGTSNGLVLAGATDTIQSLNRNTLIFGGNTTGNISFQPGGQASGNSLYLGSNGYVGIGTNNPTVLAAIKGLDSSDTTTAFEVSNSGGTPLFSVTDGANYNTVSTLNGASFDSSSGFYTGSGEGLCWDNSESCIAGDGSNTTSNDYIDFSTSGNTQMYITNTGNVGIGGTTTPAGMLSVASPNIGNVTSGFGTWNNSFSLFGPNSGSTTGTALGLGYDTTDNTAVIVSATPGNNWNELQLQSSAFSVLTDDIQGIYQNSSGDVGVGTTNPQEVLSIAGNEEVGNGDDGTPLASYIRGANASGTDIAGANLSIDASDGTGTGGSGDIVFNTAPSMVPQLEYQAYNDDSTDSSSSQNDSWNVNLINNHTDQVLIVTEYDSGTLGNNTSMTDCPTSSAPCGAGGLSFTKINSVQEPSSGGEVVMWYLLNPYPNISYVQPKLTSNAYTSTTYAEYYNVDQTTPVATSTTNSGTGTAVSKTLSSTSVGQLVIDAVGTYNGHTWIPGIGQTNIWNDQYLVGSAQAAAVSSTTMSWTISSSDHYGQIVAALNSDSTTSSSNALVQQMTILPNGNVGIGTATPSARLTIVSNASASITSENIDNENILDLTSLGVNNASMYMGVDAPSNAGFIQVSQTGLVDFLSLNPRGGSVGIGVTQAATTLQVNGTISGNEYDRAQDTVGSSNTILTDSTAGYLSYFMNANKTSGNNTTITTYDLTGLPSVSGAYVFVTQEASHNGGLGSSARECVDLEINNNQYYSGGNLCDTTGNSSSTNIQTLEFVYTDGNWQATTFEPGDGTSYAEADLAEWIPTTDSELPPEGALISLGEGVTAHESDSAYDSTVAGIVSTNPNTVYGTKNASSSAMTLAGRVPAIVTSLTGNITVGNPIVTSPITGAGMVPLQAGESVGQAMQSFDPSTQPCTPVSSYNAITWPTDDGTNPNDPCFAIPVSSFDQVTQQQLEAEYNLSATDTVYVGKIMVLVGKSYSPGMQQLTADGNLSNVGQTGNSVTNSNSNPIASSSAELSDTTSGSNVTVGNLTTNSINTQSLTLAGINVSDQLNNLETSASNEGQLTIQVNTLSNSLNTLTERVASDEAELNLLASGSALLSENPLNFSASSASQLNLDQITANNAVINSSLSVLGTTTVADLGVTGNISAGLLSIDGLDSSDGSGNAFATLNTSSGPFKIQSLDINGVDFENGQLTIDTAGNLQTKGTITALSVSTNKLNITQDTTSSESGVLSSSAGSVTISAGTTTVDIKTSALTNKSLIFVTPDQPVEIGAKAISSDTFRITLNQSQSSDVHVNWWIVN